MKKRNNYNVMLAMFIALIIVQTTVPIIGNIPFGPLSITIIPITVIVSAILMGPKFGGIVGFTWGFITFIRAYWWPTSPLAAIVLVNPVISIIPRTLIGIVIGFLYLKLKKKYNSKILLSEMGILGSLINTVIFLSLIYVFYSNQSFQLYHIDSSSMLPFLLGVAGTNGVIEMIVSGLVVPFVVKPLQKIVK
jgi:uncharacterized membrane protein